MHPSPSVESRTQADGGAGAFTTAGAANPHLCVFCIRTSLRLGFKLDDDED